MYALVRLQSTMDRDMDRDNKSAALLHPAVRRTAPKSLTTVAIGALKPGKLLADGAVRPGAGSLKVRKRKTAQGSVTEWIFEWHRDGATRRHSLGRYSATEAESCLTLSKARTVAAEWQAIIKSGGNPAAMRLLDREEVRVQQAKAIVELNTASERSLKYLLETYVTSLEQNKKADSAYDAANMFKNHVVLAFPVFAELPAASITPEHVSRILGRLVGPGVKGKKGRTALKLRSYMAAAFRLALGASVDPMAPDAAAGFGLVSNPAAAVPATKMAQTFNKAGERSLSPEELGAYLRHLDALPMSLSRLALQLQIASGGQRMQQLLRLTADNVQLDSFHIYDGKGRRVVARKHTLPMLPEIQRLFDQLKSLHPPEGRRRTPDHNVILFALDGVSLAVETPSNMVKRISNALCASKLTVATFRGGDIRRTVETLMAGRLMISKDVRAQVLSHGLTGVQDRHYDKDLHLDEKRNALREWNNYLEKLRKGSVKSSV